jgi:hypothetical protein
VSGVAGKLVIGTAAGRGQGAAEASYLAGAEVKVGSGLT